MKVILMQDVAKLGHRYDVVDVPDGRAMNMLIPKGLAKPASDENLKRIEAQAAKIAADREVNDKAFAAAVETLSNEPVDVLVEANEKGHLFQALKEGPVAEALSKKGVSVSPTQVIIVAPIKDVGEHEIILSNGGSKVTVKLNVVAK